jgi:hypothetical protein
MALRRVVVTALVAGVSAFAPARSPAAAGGGGGAAALFVRRRGAAAALRSSSSSSSTNVDTQPYLRFLETKAFVASAPKRLGVLLEVLKLRGMSLVDPTDRKELMPLVIPLARDVDGDCVGLLRWPTCPPDMQLPIVKAGEMGLSLLANEAEHFIRRVTSEEDFKGSEVAPQLLQLANAGLDTGVPPYEAGSVAKLGYGPEKYQLLRVGPFPDIYENLVQGHLAKSDIISALSAAEKANEVFQGWGRSYGFYARVLHSMGGRDAEARDAARVALRCPVWTITPSRDIMEETCRIAGYESLDVAKAFFDQLAEDPQSDKLTEGKAPAQIALDRAAHLLDAAVFGYQGGFASQSLRESLAELYEEGGLNDMAAFIL